MQYTILNLLLTIIELYWWAIIAMAVMSWLIVFEVVNMRAQGVFSIWRALNALTEPALRPIRNFLPPIGGLDLSPLVLLFALSLLRNLLIDAIGRMVSEAKHPARPDLTVALLAALHGFWIEAQRVSKADFVSVSVKLGSEAWKCVLKPRHFRWVRSVVLAISWIFSSETRSSTWGESGT